MMTLAPSFAQNLSLEKPKRPRSAKMWGHSRTLSRVEALGMVRVVCDEPVFHLVCFVTC